MAAKPSGMLGSSVGFWFGLQQAYDEKVAEFISGEEQKRETFRLLDYSFFRENFGLPDLPGKEDNQIKCVREFLTV